MIKPWYCFPPGKIKRPSKAQDQSHQCKERSDKDQSINWMEVDSEEISEELAKEALRQSELFLDNQKTLAIASDTKAITFGGFMLTAATALTGFGLTKLTSPDIELLQLTPVAAGAIQLYIAAWVSVKAAKSEAFGTGGNYPSSWLTKRNIASFKAELVSQCIFHEDFLRDNLAIQQRNGKALNTAITLGFSSPVTMSLFLLVVQAVG